MNLSRFTIALYAALTCFWVLMALATHVTVKAQALPADVGLVTKLSGEVTYWNESYQKTPARAQVFMKMRKGDRFTVPAGGLVQLVYFLGGRQETWTGPAVLTIGDAESQIETEMRPETQPRVIILPAGATQGVRRIPALLRRAGLGRPGATNVRGGVVGSPPPVALTAEEEAEIAAAKETYQSLRKQTEAYDITPELYLLGVLTDYEQYGEMEKIIQEALRRQPGNEILKQLEEWARTQSSRAPNPS